MAGIALTANLIQHTKDKFLKRDMVGKRRFDTVRFAVGGATFDAVALACENNSPVLLNLLRSVSNIYEETIAVPNCGNLKDVNMYEVFLQTCLTDQDFTAIE